MKKALSMHALEPFFCPLKAIKLLKTQGTPKNETQKATVSAKVEPKYRCSIHISQDLLNGGFPRKATM
jgi:hypothetical protein